MALPRPGTPIDLENLRGVFEQQFLAPLSLRWFMLVSETQPTYVHYADGKYTYITPDKFFWPRTAPGPSDCDWIVPSRRHV